MDILQRKNGDADGVFSVLLRDYRVSIFAFAILWYLSYVVLCLMLHRREVHLAAHTMGMTYAEAENSSYVCSREPDYMKLFRYAFDCEQMSEDTRRVRRYVCFQPTAVLPTNGLGRRPKTYAAAALAIEDETTDASSTHAEPVSSDKQSVALLTLISNQGPSILFPY